MKLQKLIIKNFRGLKGDKNVIDFSSSNIIFLIGQNNAGKSSFLRAYEFFVAAKQIATIFDFHNHSTDTPIEIEGVFLKEQEDDGNEDFVGTGKKAEPDWMNKWADENNLIRIKKIWNERDSNFTKFSFLPTVGEWQKDGFGGMDSIFTKYAPTPISISAMETEGTLEEKVNKLIQEDFLKKLRDEYPGEVNALMNGIKDLQGKIVGTDVIEGYNTDINEYFKKVFLDLTLKIEPKHEENIKLEDAFKKNHSISVRRDGVERTEYFTHHGHGVIRQALFNFISFLKKSREGNKKEYIILFEEPELYLHPEVAFRLRRNLYELAENSPFQVLCATHSPLMIDISRSHSSLVRVIKNLDETTEAYQVGDEIFRSDDERKNRIQMINRFNPHVCESFYASSVLIVEGDTEAIVFRDLISRYYNQFQVYVLNAGSKNNIPFFQEIFTAFNIEHCVIHDTDTRTLQNGHINSAWTLNERIWEKVTTANQKKDGLARRYVHMSNFETAHGVQLTGKDKPLNAYNFVIDINQNSDVPCMNWLRDLLGPKAINHDFEFIEQNVQM